MSELRELQHRFRTQAISKPDYIAAMFSHHRQLFDYADYLPWTDVSKIEILPHQVRMTLGDNNIVMVCRRDDQRIVPIDSLNFGRYESDELAMITRLARGAKTIFDIGANMGWYSLNLSRTYPQARIYSFEPIPRTYAAFVEHIGLNGCQNIQALNFGLSDHPGSFDFYVDPTTSVSASARDLSEKSDVQRVRCEVATLDAFVQQRQVQPDFIKIDVEGGELLAFRGGIETLRTARPIVFSEMLRKWSAKFNYHPNDIIKLFREIGYGCFEIGEGKLTPVEAVTDATVATNFVFLHRVTHAATIAELCPAE